MTGSLFTHWLYINANLLKLFCIQLIREIFLIFVASYSCFLRNCQSDPTTFPSWTKSIGKNHYKNGCRHFYIFIFSNGNIFSDISVFRIHGLYLVAFRINKIGDNISRRFRTWRVPSGKVKNILHVCNDVQHLPFASSKYVMKTAYLTWLLLQRIGTLGGCIGYLKVISFLRERKKSINLYVISFPSLEIHLIYIVWNVYAISIYIKHQSVKLASINKNKIIIPIKTDLKWNSILLLLYKQLLMGCPKYLFIFFLPFYTQH